MQKSIHTPSKEQVREYLQRRAAAPSPLPSMQRIRRELGWGLVQASRDKRGSR